MKKALLQRVFGRGLFDGTDAQIENRLAHGLASRLRCRTAPYIAYGDGEDHGSALFAPCLLRFNLKEICQPKLVLQNREQTEQFPLVSFGM